jgi:citrate lyase beta subunit|tara:strand:- start:4227 stop:4799 length:573 start_codon:yes stop_codon:yes gene_type:complete
MLIASQNLSNYGVPVPKNTIFRINLAWTNTLDELKTLLQKHKEHDIFVDLPIHRTKPPNNKYSLEDIIPIFQSNTNVKYLAISNVESFNDLKKYLDLLPSSITLIPKIESPTGVNNIEKIMNAIPSDQKIVMLDHDDLYSSMLKNHEPSINFISYVNKLVEYCTKNNIILLRTIGVIFSDEEKRITEYVN